MSVFEKTDLILKHEFDAHTKRHYLNGHLTVLHCHHYSTLYTQLALDSGETELLSNVAEDSFFELLSSYFYDKDIEDLKDRIDIACQYYAAIGLGKIQLNCLGMDSGVVELTHSHLDKGWIKKWGQYDKPVNYITCGYISALFSAVLDLPTRSFKVNENQSIVMGAEKSVFSVIRK